MDQRCPSYQRVAEGHLALLPESHGSIENGLRQRENVRKLKERLQVLALIVIEIVIAEHFYVTDTRDRRR